MSARDDFGSNAGTSRGYGGGGYGGRAGGLGNGGVGGGMGGGFGGGGAGRMGGIGSHTGLGTGNTMYGVAGRNGVTFSGRPGGFAQQPGAWGIHPQMGVTQGALNRPTHPSLLGNPVPAAVPVPASTTPQYPTWDGMPIQNEMWTTTLPGGWPGQNADLRQYFDGTAGGYGFTAYDRQQRPSNYTGGISSYAGARPSGATGWGR